MMTRAPPARPIAPISATTPSNAAGGTARWNSRRGVPPISFSASATACASGAVWSGSALPKERFAANASQAAPSGLAGAELLRRLPRVLTERLVGHRRPGRGRPDDPVALRHQPGHGQVEQPGQQLALGQVTGGPEQDDDVVVRSRPGPHGPPGAPGLPGLPGCRTAAAVPGLRPGLALRGHRFSPPSSPCGRRTRTAWRTAPCR